MSSICNVICISTNTQCPRPPETEKPGQHLPARVRAKPESDFHPRPKLGGLKAGRKKWCLTAPIPHCAGSLDPGHGPTSSWAPGQPTARFARLLWPKARRAGKNWHEKTQCFLWVSSTSEVSGCKCVCMCVYTHMGTYEGEDQIWRLWALQGVENRLRTYLFSFSFIAINWLLIGWNVQLFISSNTIK